MQFLCNTFNRALKIPTLSMMIIPSFWGGGWGVRGGAGGGVSEGEGTKYFTYSSSILVRPLFKTPREHS